MDTFFEIQNRVDSDRSDQDLYDETIRIEDFISVKSYGKKNC